MKQEQPEQRRDGACTCERVAGTVARYMSPVDVVLNLWASQRLHSLAQGSGYVTWAEVFPGVPIDEDGQVKPDPHDYRKDGGPPPSALQTDRADVLYESTAGKYSQVPRWDWTVLSACEVVEWAIGEFTGDCEYVTSLLLKVHPDTGRYSLPNEKNDPFVAAARRVLDNGARERDARDYARVMRSSYGAFRKVVWVAVGSKTTEDLRMEQARRALYLEHRRQINARLGREITESLATSVVESAS